MKIGTDGVLLGAWTSLEHSPEAILDVGTGTGVIALMMAQRSNAQLIDALEVEENAFEQAVANFENSDWGDRLFCYHASFEEFAEEMKDEEKYDLIVSNPPFHTDSFSTGNTQRDQARFSRALPLDSLIQGAADLLSKTGKFSLIIPHKGEEAMLEMVKIYGLHPQRLTRVKGDENAGVKRTLCEFGFEVKSCDMNELTIENGRHQYTAEYLKLVQEFYLKM